MRIKIGFYKVRLIKSEVNLCKFKIHNYRLQKM